MPTRREFLKSAALGTFGLFLPFKINLNMLTPEMLAAITPTLDLTGFPKFVTPLVIPPAMPRTGKIKQKAAKNIDYYEIAVRQFDQQILPVGYPATTVWSYGSANHPGTFNYPAFTIEAKYDKPVRVKWINDLRDPVTGAYLSHILPVDQTLHWANPPGGVGMRDMRGNDPAQYDGPVPIVTHVHGAHTHEESDGYAEAWYLPDATNIPAGYAETGSWYQNFADKAAAATGVWPAGTSIFDYPNTQRATTLWYHDHTLGMTRLNVYAGPAGFFLIRGGPDDIVLDINGLPAVLPGPAPALGDAPGMTYYEIPIVVQDRSFNDDGALFYPDNRAFFEGLNPEQLQIPFISDPACDGSPSDISPIWNPEFFGNTMVVNGNTWPYLNVEQRRYRFRYLNGCNSRFLILKHDTGLPFWQIGADGGFLPAPAMLDQLLLSPAERADVIVDFTNVPVGSTVTLINLAPDEPFGGGVPGVDFDPADPNSTGLVMQFTVVGPAVTPDLSTPPDQLVLPAHIPLPAETFIRKVSLNELDSASVKVVEEDGNLVLACDDPDAEPFGPMEAQLGTVTINQMGEIEPVPLEWMHAITENPGVGSTEIWEIFNFTMDAHPIHVHQVQFEVVERQDLMNPAIITPPEPGETGLKDTVIAYPDQITRIRAHFDLPGLYVWHCHIVEHEDNEMMRPFYIGSPIPPELMGG